MRRQPLLTPEFIASRLEVDVQTGMVRWLDATKHHRNLVGQIAGCQTSGRNGKDYWVIRINGIGYKRSHIVFTMKTGAWPTAEVDHKDGNSLNDNGDNLRAATHMQNCWNHKSRRKKSDLPMGVRKTNSGQYEARIAVNKRKISLGTHATPDAAYAAYQEARCLHFGEFA